MDCESESNGIGQDGWLRATFIRFQPGSGAHGVTRPIKRMQDLSSQRKNLFCHHQNNRWLP